MIKYFEVEAKCGHVGRNNFYKGSFYVIGDSMSNAACMVKDFPRVKSDHRDAILSVREVNRSEYMANKDKWKDEPYFQCHSKHEQKEKWDLIKANVLDETERQMTYRKYFDKDYKKIGKRVKGIRNPYKYAKMNMKPEYNFDEFDFA